MSRRAGPPAFVRRFGGGWCVMSTSVFRATCLLPVCLLVLTAPAYAQPRLSLAALIDEALQASAAVQAASQRTLAASARIEQVRVRPDPMLSGGYRSVGSPLPGAGLRTEPLASFSVMASQAIPLPGRRALETTAATNDRDAERPLAEAIRLASGGMSPPGTRRGPRRGHCRSCAGSRATASRPNSSSPR